MTNQATMMVTLRARRKMRASSHTFTVSDSDTDVSNRALDSVVNLMKTKMPTTGLE